MSLLRSLTRIASASAELVDKTAVRPIADAIDVAAEGLKGMYPDDERDDR